MKIFPSVTEVTIQLFVNFNPDLKVNILSKINVVHAKIYDFFDKNIQKMTKF